MSSFAPKIGSGNPKRTARARRHLRVRKKISGSAQRPRLVVSRSARHVVAQVIDDGAGRTLASASTMEADIRTSGSDKTAQARQVGELVAARAKQAGVEPWLQLVDREVQAFEYQTGRVFERIRHAMPMHEPGGHEAADGEAQKIAHGR